MQVKIARIFFLLVFCALFLASGKEAFGQTNTNLVAPLTNPDVPQNLHTTTQSVMIEVLAALTCQISGFDLLDPKRGCLGIDTKSGKIGYLSQNTTPYGTGGAIGVMTGLIGATYNIPISTHDYLAYLSGNFGIAKSAYAQGVGLQGLAPVFKLWEAFRNITYFIFVLVLVVVGLGIMFRIQIDPRTVMTIQNQIPKVIIGLILVSLSYAIAGLMIDLMWVVIYLIFSAFTSVDPDVKLVLPYLHNTPFGFVDKLYQVTVYGGIVPLPRGLVGIITGSSTAFGNIITDLINGGLKEPKIGTTMGDVIATSPVGLPYYLECLNKVKAVTSFGFIPDTNLNSIGDAINCAVIGAATTTVGKTVIGIPGTIIGSIGGLIAFFIITIALLFSLARLWFQLLKSYVFIFLDVIFAPFWIVAGIIPGGGGGFGSWFRDLLANLSVFPAVIVLFLIAKSITRGFATSPNVFVPPLIGNPSDPSQPIAALIGLGLILMSPAVTSIVREAVKAPQMKHMATVGAMAGIGGAIVGGTVGGIIGGSWSRAMRRDAAGNPVGGLATLIDTKIKSPFIRQWVLGWKPLRAPSPTGGGGAAGGGGTGGAGGTPTGGGGTGGTPSGGGGTGGTGTSSGGTTTP